MGVTKNKVKIFDGTQVRTVGTKKPRKTLANLGVENIGRKRGIMETDKKGNLLSENDLLNQYLTKYKGSSFAEVSVGDKKTLKNSQDRRIDIVRVNNVHENFFYRYGKSKGHFLELVKSNQYDIELVEIKSKLNRGVIGQIIVGEYLFKKKYNVKNCLKAILYHIGDELLEIFCMENNIRLLKESPNA